MFEEGKDESAAYEEFLQIFANKEGELKFTINFGRKYQAAKESFKIYENMAEKINAEDPKFIKIMDRLGKFILRMLDDVFTSLVKYTESDNVKEKSIYLGKALGMLLGVCEYGITSKIFNLNMPKDFSEDCIAYSAKIGTFYEYSLGKGKKPQFIKERIEKIARKKAKELSGDQTELISSFAAKLAG